MTRTRPLVAVLLSGVLTAACGNRLSHRDIVSASSVQGARGASSQQASAGPVDSAGVADGVAGAVTAAPGEVRSGITRSSPVATGSVITSGGITPAVSERVADRSPAKIASVGTVSGPVGATVGPLVVGLQAWVNAVNAKGGVNGHLVRLSLADDGGDPARHRALVAEAIEKQGVIAFVDNTEGVSGGPSREYITAKRVPVIGSDFGTPWFYDGPMYFPQGSMGDGFLFSSLASAAQQLVPEGKTKLGTIACVEPIQVCKDADRVWNTRAAALGMTNVYRAQGSIAQPDYTAECLSARRAGVQVFLIALDSNSQQRLAASCARQGFRPVYDSLGTALQDRFKDDPNLAGMVGATTNFPYFQGGTPATDEYQAAIRTFVKGTDNGVGLSQGWVAAKMFEKAAANLPEPPTAAAVLRGLWAMKGETLDGLAMPLTFIENKPPPTSSCWFNLRIRDRRWISPDGFKLQCR